MVEEFQDLQTRLNLKTDFTGSFARMLSTMSCGRWLFLRQRIGGCGQGCLICSTMREREQ